MKEDRIYLVQTDTTVGFLSQNFQKLNLAKKRDLNTPCIKSVGELKQLLLHVRVPNRFKNIVRKSKKMSFIYPNNQSIRVVKTSPHKDFLIEHEWMYSTSANITGRDFNKDYAISVADIVCEDERGFCQNPSSTIVKLGKNRKRRIRK